MEIRPLREGNRLRKSLSDLITEIESRITVLEEGGEPTDQLNPAIFTMSFQGPDVDSTQNTLLIALTSVTTYGVGVIGGTTNTNGLGSLTWSGGVWTLTWSGPSVIQTSTAEDATGKNVPMDVSAWTNNGGFVGVKALTKIL